MSATGLHHQDDGGTVSLFGVGDEMLFACTEGHWWIVKAESVGSASDDARPAKPEVEALRQAFGVDALTVMKLDE